MALPDGKKNSVSGFIDIYIFFRIARFPIIKCKISSQSVRTNEPYVIVTDVLSSYSLLPALPPLSVSVLSGSFSFRLPFSAPRAPVVSVLFRARLFARSRSFVCSFVPSPTSTLRRNINGAERTLSATTDRALPTMQSMNDGIVRRAQ